MQSDTRSLIEQAISLINTDPKTAIKLVHDVDDPAAKQVLGIAYINDRRFEDAIDLFSKLIGDDPTNSDLLINLGSAYQHNGDMLAAENVYLSAIESSGSYLAYTNLGNVYKTTGRYSEAIQAYNKSLSIHYSESTAVNLSGAYLESRQPRLAINLLESIENPGVPVHIDLAMAYFATRQWKKASEHFEKRFEFFPAAKAIRVFYPADKTWRGEAGTVYIYCEQGAGDLIHFTRYHKPLEEAYPQTKFVWNVPDNFKTLFESQNIPVGSATDPYDAHLSVFDLPGIFDSLGPSHSYISVKPARYDNYGNKLKVGIVWGGNAAFPRDSHRSLHLRHLRELSSIPNISLFSLQKDYRSRYWHGYGIVDLTEGARDMPIIGMQEYMQDWYTTARLIAGLDVVISVDTAILHLAGALGVPTLAMIPWSPDWRWGTYGKDCELYDSVKLFRQPKFGDWKPVARDIVKAIRKMATK